MKLQRTGESSEIPTSSMADIAFLLIIFFMVTAVFSATKGLEFKLPKDEDNSPAEEEEAIFIKVNSATDILVDCKPKSLSEILPYLELTGFERGLLVTELFPVGLLDLGLELLLVLDDLLELLDTLDGVLFFRSEDALGLLQRLDRLVLLTDGRDGLLPGNVVDRSRQHILRLLRQ